MTSAQCIGENQEDLDTNREARRPGPRPRPSRRGEGDRAVRVRGGGTRTRPQRSLEKGLQSQDWRERESAVCEMADLVGSTEASARTVLTSIAPLLEHQKWQVRASASKVLQVTFLYNPDLALTWTEEQLNTRPPGCRTIAATLAAATIVAERLSQISMGEDPQAQITLARAWGRESFVNRLIDSCSVSAHGVDQAAFELLSSLWNFAHSHLLATDVARSEEGSNHNRSLADLRVACLRMKRTIVEALDDNPDISSNARSCLRLAEVALRRKLWPLDYGFYTGDPSNAVRAEAALDVKPTNLEGSPLFDQCSQARRNGLRGTRSCVDTANAELSAKDLRDMWVYSLALSKFKDPVWKGLVADQKQDRSDSIGPMLRTAIARTAEILDLEKLPQKARSTSSPPMFDSARTKMLPIWLLDASHWRQRLHALDQVKRSVQRQDVEVIQQLAKFLEGTVASSRLACGALEALSELPIGVPLSLVGPLLEQILNALASRDRETASNAAITLLKLVGRGSVNGLDCAKCFAARLAGMTPNGRALQGGVDQRDIRERILQLFAKPGVGQTPMDGASQPLSGRAALDQDARKNLDQFRSMIVLILVEILKEAQAAGVPANFMEKIINTLGEAAPKGDSVAVDCLIQLALSGTDPAIRLATLDTLRRVSTISDQRIDHVAYQIIGDPDVELSETAEEISHLLRNQLVEFLRQEATTASSDFRCERGQMMPMPMPPLVP